MYFFTDPNAEKAWGNLKLLNSQFGLFVQCIEVILDWTLVKL